MFHVVLIRRTLVKSQSSSSSLEAYDLVRKHKTLNSQVEGKESQIEGQPFYCMAIWLLDRKFNISRWCHLLASL